MKRQLLTLLIAPALHAHVTSGYLQSSLVDVSPERVTVRLTLTPGVDRAATLIKMFDRNHDGDLDQVESENWLHAAARDQHILIDGVEYPTMIEFSQAASAAEMRTGHGELVINFAATITSLPRGRHQIECINGHLPAISRYQANGVVPRAPGVSIDHHHTDEKQQRLTLSISLAAPAGQALPRHAALPSRELVAGTICGLACLFAPALWKSTRHRRRLLHWKT